MFLFKSLVFKQITNVAKETTDEKLVVSFVLFIQNGRVKACVSN